MTNRCEPSVACTRMGFGQQKQVPYLDDASIHPKHANHMHLVGLWLAKMYHILENTSIDPKHASHVHLVGLESATMSPIPEQCLLPPQTANGILI